MSKFTLFARQFLPALLVAVTLGVTSCGLLRTAPDLAGLRNSTDEAAVLMGRAADPAEFTTLSTRLDDLIADVPAGSLGPGEQQTVDLATQRAAALRELALMLGASDDVANTISTDAVELVTGSLLRKPSPEFRQHLDTTARRLLKETTCSMFADAMSDESAARLPEAVPDGLPPTQQGVLEAFKAAIVDANYDLADAAQTANLAGLSDGLLFEVKGYVGRIQRTMTAASWHNSGAFQAYLRHCL